MSVYVEAPFSSEMLRTYVEQEGYEPQIQSPHAPESEEIRKEIEKRLGHEIKISMDGWYYLVMPKGMRSRWVPKIEQPASEDNLDWDALYEYAFIKAELIDNGTLYGPEIAEERCRNVWIAEHPTTGIQLVYQVKTASPATLGLQIEYPIKERRAQLREATYSLMEYILQKNKE